MPTNNVPEPRYYPSLQNLITLDDLPDALDFIKTVISDVFSKIHYKDYQSAVSADGASAFHSLRIVTRDRISANLIYGLKFILNRDFDDQNISSFPVTVRYHWPILAYLKSFDLNGFSFTPREFFDIGLVVLNVTEEDLLAKAINTLVTVPDISVKPINKFVDDINSKFGDLLDAPIPYPISGDKITELLVALKSKIGETASEIVFLTYILATTDLQETKNRMNTFFRELIPADIEDYLLQLMKPVARVTLELAASIEFPRNILVPWEEVNGVLTRVEDENVKSYFDFAKATLYADTKAGIGYNLELAGTLNPGPAEIGRTGILLEIDSLKLDLSTKTNIPEATADGRADDFTGVYARALSVTLPARWFQDDAVQGTPSTGLRIGGYDLLIGTGGISGTFMLEAIPIAISSPNPYYFEDKFEFLYPVTLFQKNSTTDAVEEIQVHDINQLKQKLFPNSTTVPSYPFKFPLSVKSPPVTGTVTTFQNIVEYQLFVNSFTPTGNPDPVPTLWKKVGGDSGFRIGFTKFDITFKQNKVTSSNIKGALEIKKFVYPGTSNPVHIDIQGHLSDDGDFNLTASAQPPYPIQLKDVFTYGLKTVELGREEENFYIGTSGTLQFEGFLKETMGLGPIEIERLRIYSDGSIELKGGAINLIKPIVLNLGPVEITVTAIHYGSHQKEVDGVMRKFNYFGFDGGISVDPLGVEIRGDGVKFYYCTDDVEGHEKPKPYLHIKTLYLDLTLPANTPVAIVNGWVSIPEPGVSKEYSGGLKLQLPKLKITGSVDMKLMPKYPAFLIDASLDFPGPIPLGPIGIYGFRGLFGYRYVAEKEAIGMVSGVNTWYEYYKAPQRGINVRKFSGPDQTTAAGTPISIGAGASLGTSADNGTVLNIRAMVLLSIPSLFMIDGRAAVLSARLGLDATQEPPFFAFIAVGDDSLELGFGADFKMPTSSGSMFSIYADVQAGFFFRNQKPWYVNFGTDTNPITARVLSLITLKSYLMLSAKGIAAGARGDFDFKRKYGIIRVHAWAYIEVGGKISFERPQFGAYLKAGVGADIDIKFISLYLAVDIMFGVEASRPFKIFGSFYYKVRIRILWVFSFSFKGYLDVVWEFNNQVDRTPISPMIKTQGMSVQAIETKMAELVTGVNMLSNEKFKLAYLGDHIPTGITSQLDAKILNKIIPIDTYIDIKTEKGLMPGANVTGNSVRKLLGGINNPAERYTDLIPPDATVKGKPIRQVKHRYSLEKIEIKFWNGSSWVDYHPYEAMYPQDLGISNLKIGQFQKTDGQYNMVRLLATTPFSYTEQGQPGWYVPEQYGITAATLFCEGQQIEKKCANFEFMPLGRRFYCGNPNHLLYSNQAAFQLLNPFDNVYAEVTDETYFPGLTHSLKFSNQNQMQVLFPNAAVQIGLKISNFAHGVRIKYYATLASAANDLLLNPVYGNPDPTAINQNDPYIVEKTADDLDTLIEYNKPDWRGVIKVVIEPLYDPAVAIQIALLTEQIAAITENNNLISLQLADGELIDTTSLENQLQQLMCGDGTLETFNTFVNRYDHEDRFNYRYSEEFIENGIPYIYAVGQTQANALVSKLAANGDVIWQKKYVIPDESPMVFRKIIQLKQSASSTSRAYVVYATTEKHHYLIGLKSSGEVDWARQFNWDYPNVTVQLMASLSDTNFYVSISGNLPTEKAPQVILFSAAGNPLNGISLHVVQKDFYLSAMAVDTLGLVLAGHFSEEDGTHGAIVRLSKNLGLVNTVYMVESGTVIHDVAILAPDRYLASGYHTKSDSLFVTELTPEGDQALFFTLYNTSRKTSQLQRSANGFYLLAFDAENGVLYKMDTDFSIRWLKTISFDKDPSNGFNHFRFNLQTDRLTFNAFANSSGSVIGHANRELQTCLTEILETLKPDKNETRLKNFSPAIEKFNIDLKSGRPSPSPTIARKMEFCPIFIDTCGKEDQAVCELYNEVFSIANECLEDPTRAENADHPVYPFVDCMGYIWDLIQNFDPSYDLLTLLDRPLSDIMVFIKAASGSESLTIRECPSYTVAWNAVAAIVSRLDDLGNCNCLCQNPDYTLLHEVCWMTVEDYDYNINIPSQTAISEDASATIKGITDYIQPVWRPDTHYYVRFELRDTVETAGSFPFNFTYGFTTGGSVGYFHTHPKSDYGDIPLKAGQYLDTDLGPILLTSSINGKILEDTKGIIRNQDGSVYDLPSGQASQPIAKIAPHADKYPLTSLSQYIDYQRSYPNANGNLLSAKPLFYKDDTTSISLFFNKAYAKNFFREWPEYRNKPSQKGRLKIVIKDPIEGTEIVNPPALNFDQTITTIPQTQEEWKSDVNPQVPFVLSQYEAMYNAPNCIGGATIIKPKSEYITITPKFLKPNKLYTAIVNNMYTTNTEFATTPEQLLGQTREVHRFVFKTSRYETFKQQVESFVNGQVIDGSLVQKEALFTMLQPLSPDQINGAYNTIIGQPVSGFDPVILANFANNYQHPFDRLLEGIFGMKPLDEAICTEINIIRNASDGKAIALLIRNPEPFNDPKMPLADVSDTVEVWSQTAVNTDYKILHSKDYSQVLIMHSSKQISGKLNMRFKYKIWDGTNYVVPSESLNPQAPAMYTITLQVKI
ncbi:MULTISPECIES: hypothetical protein [unclassified Flavobacterium]|uniref:hypothetical protein n=1 Tax=unclassified Flavobacterium TaxID=196869 RepID=UPI001F140AFA|nr:MULTISPECIES: hypothetical protein [unclassified Flavobacterium]UMY66134.1 hypothetical protein MKO97_01780 [Flavobacterium sp. HJ-32-4]